MKHQEEKQAYEFEREANRQVKAAKKILGKESDYFEEDNRNMVTSIAVCLHVQDFNLETFINECSNIFLESQATSVGTTIKTEAIKLFSSFC